MSTLSSTSNSYSADLSQGVQHADVSSRWLKNSAYITAALLVVCAVAYMFDTRLLTGVNVWTKPNKFNASFLMQLLTVLWLWQLVEPVKRATKFAVGLMAALSLSGLFEIFYIAFQSARGRASHFNNQTTWEAAMYSLMGIAAVILVVTTAIAGWKIWRNATPAARRNKGLYVGAALGLILGGIATLITASALGSGQIAGPGHWVGGARTDVGGLPILGWSSTGGDLRVPHFFATHLMQALPIVGILADRFLPSLAALLVWLASFVGLAVVVLTFMQAVNGHSFHTFVL